MNKKTVILGDDTYELMSLEEAQKRAVCSDVYALRVSQNAKGKFHFTSHYLSSAPTGSIKGKTLYAKWIASGRFNKKLQNGSWAEDPDAEILNELHFPAFQKPTHDLQKAVDRLEGFTAYDEIGDDVQVSKLFINRLTSLYELEETMVARHIVETFKKIMEDEFDELLRASNKQ